MNNSTKISIFGGLLFLSIIFSYVISEDTLGGAKQDYYTHENFLYLFADDFINTFKNYPSYEFTRNSPFFYIIFSQLYKLGLDLNTLRHLNVISAFFIVYLFYKCLKIKFPKVNIFSLQLFSFILFLSPTIRSLTVWPYPIFYAYIFFLVSIKYYLLFQDDKKNKTKNALLNVFFIAITSYITPNFCVFAIYFTYKFFLEFKFTRYFQYILLLNFFLALPGFIYFHVFDYYLFKVSVSDVSTSMRFNIFNKIVIISSLIFFYYIPFVNNKIISKTTDVFKNIKNEYFLVLFFLICTFFFNFPSGFFGGGVFYHLSQKILNNNLLLFLIFGLSLILFKGAKLFKIENIILFVCMILYNLQVSIYHKYFDPLLLFVFLFLLEKDQIKNHRSFLNITKNFYILYLIFLGMSFYKVNFL